MKRILFSALVCALFTFGVQAQDFHMPAASPGTKITQEFSTSSIDLEYSRPVVRDRVIFGDLIPYGEVWRTGANETTKVTLGEDLKLNGETVEAGTYALYTVPGEKEWTIILNKGVDNWGADGFDEKQNVLETNVKPKKLSETQESFSLTVEEVMKNSAKLVMAWDDTKIEVPIEADNHERILQHLKEELKGDNPPYHVAAGYYLSTDHNLKDALKYSEKAIEKEGAFYMYWTKAQILEKLGKHKKALKAAKKAADITKEKYPAYHHEYQQNYEKLKNN